MRTTRRRLLATMAGAAAWAGGCSGEGETTDGPSEDLEPGDWTPGGTEDLAAFPYGVQAGDPLSDGIVLSVRTDEAEVDIQVVKITDAGWREVHASSARVDGDLQLQIDGLEPDTSYAWVVWADDDRRSLRGTFRTAPAAGSAPLRFGAVSCLGGNEPWPCLTRAAEDGLDVFLLLGDTIYADWGSDESFRKKWDAALQQDGLQDLAASTALIATWDDHEVRNNWNPETTSDADKARGQFQRAIPQRTGPTGGIWRQLEWGDTAAFFVLDCRSERWGDEYVSRAQLDWLKDALSASTARFKIVLNSVPITDLSPIPVYGTIGEEDRWQGYPAQRSELVAHCAGIEGVLFVSGDFHVGGAMYIDDVGGPGEAIPEVLAGPGGSPIHEMYSLVPAAGRILAVITEHNYTRFECFPDTGRVDVCWIDNDGNEVGRTVLVV